ncbi:MAG: Maf family nucleotide pyrophosphatase [Bacteroidetes bacterium]|nr:Septum formation protein Maf [Bacteroidia bacterium]MBX3106765.1 septum formation protein Maf [Bacteroidota bacterium]MCB0849587.1 septum formation protein Maf [Bacteroidota bacterium]MCB8929473.1 septum formation protein Maf [Bacteroidia bacterium]MCO5288916.1 Maf family nucleotide pyrophosphatase [Bacteroidota bacterium]
MIPGLQHRKIILASQSPRRKQLFDMMNIPVEVRSFQTDETFPSHLKNEQIVLHLALKKALTAVKDLKEAELLITADTIVVYDEKVLNKPAGKDEAIHMLTMLSGKMHEVYTGVCISSTEKKEVFFDRSEVHFREYGIQEILFYIEHYKPFDKAGSYGIQDWFGLTCIEKINGCFYNVMGLPTRKVYQYLHHF